MADAVYTYVEPTGVIIPNAEMILEQVQQEFKNAFGQDLDISPSTPQGVLIASETLSRFSVAANNASLANQNNPNFSGGIFLDATLALTGTKRTVSSFTTVVGTVTGVQGTIIPSGSQARETVNGEIFETTTAITIPLGNTDTVTFQAQTAGPIPVNAGTLTELVSTVIGWETVTNAASGELGVSTQSDEKARNFRKETLFIQGQALPEAMLSGVNAVPNVTSSIFRENLTAAPAVIDGVLIAAKSIYMCVAGGLDTEVALAMTTKKGGGCGYSNGPGIPESVPTTVPFSGQIIDVLFDRPIEIPILVQVTINADDTLSDPVTAVRDAIVNYADGNIPGEPGLKIGVDVSSFELAGAVNFYNRGIFVKNLEISLAAPISFSCDTIPIELFQIAIIQSSSIEVFIV